MSVPNGTASRFVTVDGWQVHYLDAGDPRRPTLVLLHSCDFGACAEVSWGANIPVLARRFHVVAPDALGYGLSDKVYDFGGGHMPYRLRTLRRFLEILEIDDADFAGNSCGASMLLTVAATHGAEWRRVLPIRRMVLVSPSAIGTPGPGRAVHDAYDGSREAMCRLVRATFCSPTFAEDEGYVDTRQFWATRPGHWETVVAAKLAMPGRPPAPPQRPRWSGCLAPALFVTGDSDSSLAEPDGAIDNVRDVAGARFHVFARSGHFSQVEHPAAFNELLLDYLDPMTT